MTSARDFARHAKNDEFGHQRRAKYSWMGGYIVIQEGDFPKIVGRVFGGDGYAHYQIAARPNDETSVGPFPNRQEAFNECAAELDRRSKLK